MPTFKVYSGRVRSKYHYFCEECNEFAEVEVHNFPSASIRFKYAKTNPGAEARGLDLWIKCPKCGDFMFEIDEKMVKYIERFNIDKKIKTQWCCEGHFKGEDLHTTEGAKNIPIYQRAYIQFYPNKDLVKLIDRMSDKWKNLVDIDYYKSDDLSIGTKPVLIPGYSDIVNIHMKDIDADIENMDFGTGEYLDFCRKQADFFIALNELLEVLPDKLDITWNPEKKDIKYETSFN